jgi:hypothetical protein
MRDSTASVQVFFESLVDASVGQHAKLQRLIVLAIWLVVSCDIPWGEAGTSEDTGPKSDAAHGDQENPQPKQPSPHAGLVASVDGFRQARFGMSEDQVRQAIHKDFPALAGKLTSAVHPSEKTNVLSLTVADLLPHTGNAHISYIFGYHSKQLVQVNIVWSSDGTTASDETIVGTANSLRDYFTSENFAPENVVINRQLAENTILVFRASDERKRTILLILSRVPAAARSEEKKGPRAPPLMLELSYIEDAAHPDVFRIGKGQF